jgi:hypothetical protein
LVPPPAAANVVVEQLGEARHKRPHCLHVTVAPRLMTSRWQKGLLKESDLEIVVPVGSGVWTKEQHEPSLMFVSFPLCRHPPWSLRGTNCLDSFRQELHSVWEAMPERTGLHCARWRTLEQQGREDNEGKGQRLAVDVKSDLC